MKKSPRKFQAGGATPAPATKPASKGGPKELQEEAEKVRQAKLDEAQRKAGQQRPDLSKPFKKGGKVRKFSGEDESFVGEAPKVRERPIPLPSGNEARDAETATNPNTRYGRFDDDDIYRRAYEQANRLREPSGAEVKEVKANTGLKEPSVRKPTPKRFAPKPAPKVASKPEPKPAPKAAAKSETKTEAPSESLSQGLGRKFAATESAFRSAPAGTSPTAYAALKKARDDAESAYSKSVDSERTGKSVVKMAKGGGVEAKGKTKGKIVKMAKGGSVRGYGISKVTNKTKIV